MTDTDRLAGLLAALTDEDEIAHGEAWLYDGDNAGHGLGVCAYCDDKWPCRTQRGIDRALAGVTQPPAPAEGLCMARPGEPCSDPVTHHHVTSVEGLPLHLSGVTPYRYFNLTIKNDFDWLAAYFSGYHGVPGLRAAAAAAAFAEDWSDPAMDVYNAAPAEELPYQVLDRLADGGDYRAKLLRLVEAMHGFCCDGWGHDDETETKCYHAARAALTALGGLR